MPWLGAADQLNRKSLAKVLSLARRGYLEMITLFTTAKPFVGHSAVIQRNALASWRSLHPDVEILLFGDEEGAAENAAELGFRHVPAVRQGPQGLKVLPSFFDEAQRIARHDVLCYVNCDIVLTRDFLSAVNVVEMVRGGFLMVGRRSDIDFAEPISLQTGGWEQQLRDCLLRQGELRSGDWIDYFVFPRGFYLGKLPDLVIGRVHWDQWLVWRARKDGVAIVDASEAVTAIHQNHDYGYHAAGKKGVWLDELSQRNYALTGGRWHLCTIDDATHLLGRGGLRENPLRKRRRFQRWLRLSKESVWLTVLDRTRPLRRLLGAGSKAA